MLRVQSSGLAETWADAAGDGTFLCDLMVFDLSEKRLWFYRQDARRTLGRGCQHQTESAGGLVCIGICFVFFSFCCTPYTLLLGSTALWCARWHNGRNTSSGRCFSTWGKGSKAYASGDNSSRLQFCGYRSGHLSRSGSMARDGGVGKARLDYVESMPEYSLSIPHMAVLWECGHLGCRPSRLSFFTVSLGFGVYG